jgi:hypothetical protein
VLEQPNYLGTMRVAAASYALAGRLDAARKAVARLAEIHILLHQQRCAKIPKYPAECA